MVVLLRNKYSNKYASHTAALFVCRCANRNQFITTVFSCSSCLTFSFRLPGVILSTSGQKAFRFAYFPFIYMRLCMKSNEKCNQNGIIHICFTSDSLNMFNIRMKVAKWIFPNLGCRFSWYFCYR